MKWYGISHLGFYNPNSLAQEKLKFFIGQYSLSFGKRENFSVFFLGKRKVFASGHFLSVLCFKLEQNAVGGNRTLDSSLGSSRITSILRPLNEIDGTQGGGRTLTP